MESWNSKVFSKDPIFEDYEYESYEVESADYDDGVKDGLCLSLPLINTLKLISDTGLLDGLLPDLKIKIEEFNDALFAYGLENAVLNYDKELQNYV